MSQDSLKNRQVGDYPFRLEYRTRWIDSIINAYLIQECGRHPPTSDQVGLVVHTHCDFFAPIAYPAVAELGLRVVKLGKSSTTYEVGIFEKDKPGVRAVGELVHVFVDSKTRRPHPEGMEKQVKEGLGRLATPTAKL
ncbi:MAG: hypothetical protein M1820_001085 [Bogoriella megaspora]|nr:MAG: hypothetical protein M1820_001085 [Bogoriella megaspora]